MIIIALGSNMPGPWGSPRQAVERALQEMARRGVRPLQVSPLVETAPFGNVHQPHFVNALAIVETHKPPDALMRCLHDIERTAGRQRRKRWGPRTLDLDLLDYHGLVRNPRSQSYKPLRLPHPGIAGRRFVLEPLAALAPAWVHPVLRQSPRQLLAHLKTD